MEVAGDAVGRSIKMENVPTKIVINMALREIEMKRKLGTLGCTLFALCTLAFTMSGCARDYSSLKPDHIGLRTGVDFEIQEGCKTKTKPGSHICVDWNL